MWCVFDPPIFLTEILTTHTGASLGYIYSRMLRKCLQPLGQAKEWERELSIIQRLLDQRMWLRGKRGKLYERRAILQMHLHKNNPQYLQDALEGVREALKDDDTHLGLWYFP